MGYALYKKRIQNVYICGNSVNVRQLVEILKSGEFGEIAATARRSLVVWLSTHRHHVVSKAIGRELWLSTRLRCCGSVPNAEYLRTGFDCGVSLQLTPQPQQSQILQISHKFTLQPQKSTHIRHFLVLSSFFSYLLKFHIFVYIRILSRFS